MLAFQVYQRNSEHILIEVKPELEGLYLDGTDSLRLKAFAKINLTLNITGRRDDGYHYVDMVMQSVDLHDVLTLTLRDKPGIVLKCLNGEEQPADLPADETNLAWKAAKVFLSTQKLEDIGVHILLEKHIPIAAGLAGGSADAAAVLYGLDRMCQTRCSSAELTDMALSVGADVPFCLKGGTMNAEGIGESLTPLSSMPDCYILLCKPALKIETAKAYALFDEHPADQIPDTEQMIGALAVGDLDAVSGAVCNIFEQVLDLPEVKNIKAVMKKYGALTASMSGSGPTVFGIFEKKSEAERAASALRKKYNEVFICRPVDRGIDAERISTAEI